MMDDDALFIDTNVLVYANVAEAPFHRQALSALSRRIWQAKRCGVAKSCANSLRRSRPQDFAPAASSEVVVERLRYFAQHFEVADESSLVTERLLGLLMEHRIGGKRVHDANIVATMMAYGIPTLLTHNVADFECFGKQIALESIG